MKYALLAVLLTGCASEIERVYPDDVSERFFIEQDAVRTAYGMDPQIDLTAIPVMVEDQYKVEYACRKRGIEGCFNEDMSYPEIHIIKGMGFEDTQWTITHEYVHAAMFPVDTSDHPPEFEAMLEKALELLPREGACDSVYEATPRCIVRL